MSEIWNQQDFPDRDLHETNSKLLSFWGSSECCKLHAVLSHAKRLCVTSSCTCRHIHVTTPNFDLPPTFDLWPEWSSAVSSFLPWDHVLVQLQILLRRAYHWNHINSTHFCWSCCQLCSITVKIGSKRMEYMSASTYFNADLSRPVQPGFYKWP